jgi:hypothetical protein
LLCSCGIFVQTDIFYPNKLLTSSYLLSLMYPSSTWHLNWAEKKTLKNWTRPDLLYASSWPLKRIKRKYFRPKFQTYGRWYPERLHWCIPTGRKFCPYFRISSVCSWELHSFLGKQGWNGSSDSYWMLAWSLYDFVSIFPLQIKLLLAIIVRNLPVGRFSFFFPSFFFSQVFCSQNKNNGIFILLIISEFSSQISFPNIITPR